MATLAQPESTSPGLERRWTRPDAGHPGALLRGLVGAVLTLATVLLVTGALGPDGAPTWLQGLTLGALGILGATTFARRAGSAETRAQASETVAGILAVLGLQCALRMAGSLGADLYPVTWVLVAWLATVGTARAALACVAFAAALEIAAHVLGHPLGAAAGADVSLPLRLGFIATFASLSFAFHRAGVARSMRDLAVADHRRRKHQQARAKALRLDAGSAVTSLDPPRDDADAEQAAARLLGDAIDACDQNTARTLRLLKEAVDARTVVLLEITDDGHHLELRAAASELDLDCDTPIPVGAGILGGITRQCRAMQVRSPRQPLPWYGSRTVPTATGAFFGMPVVENARLVGVLCVDRAASETFEPAQQRLVVAAAEQIARSIGNERLFVRMERARSELRQVFDASRALSSALDLNSVLSVSLETLGSLCAYDAAAITLFDAERREHEIAAVRGSAFAKLEGHRFADNKGLVAQVVRMRHYLPAGGECRDERCLVFEREARLRGIESLLVLPLIARDRAIGTLVLAVECAGAFADSQHRQMLGVVANQVAVAVANAQMYTRMEQLATTDGLTGLLNRRTFVERYETGLARCARSQRQASVILTDIDFFKKVNDTYGHPVGDEVLRQVAATFEETLRCVDIVGRYGGEEFVILLEDTDTAGALQMAERLRRAVEALEIDSAKGTFGVSISLGVSTWGRDAEDPEALIELADQALYACKQAGRNRALAWSSLPASSRNS